MAPLQYTASKAKQAESSAAKSAIDEARVFLKQVEASKQNVKVEKAILMSSLLVCTRGGGVLSFTENGQSGVVENVDIKYLAYGAESIVNNLEDGFFRLYDNPTLATVQERYNTGDLYDKYDQEPYSAIQGFGGSASALNKNGNLTTYGEPALDTSKGALVYNGIERYCIALGPKLQNPNFDLTKPIDVTDMAYGTCVDVEILLDGQTYYIPAIIVDVKNHTHPTGVFQTKKGSMETANIIIKEILLNGMLNDIQIWEPRRKTSRQD